MCIQEYLEFFSFNCMLSVVFVLKIVIILTFLSEINFCKEVR